jgi:hypothetical protein
VLTIYTPWGASQTKQNISRGIILVTTASHGGVHLSPTVNDQVHPAWRDEHGWYEEDCEANIAVVTFPDEFKAAGWTEEHVTKAAESLRRWYPDQYMTVYGVTIDPSESHVLRERLFREQHANDWITITAWGDWHEDVPEGMVGVAATKGGTRESDVTRGHFLIPKDEYDDRGEFSFVVDTTRHEGWTAYPGRVTKCAN